MGKDKGKGAESSTKNVKPGVNVMRVEKSKRSDNEAEAPGPSNPKTQPATKRTKTFAKVVYNRNRRYETEELANMPPKTATFESNSTEKVLPNISAKRTTPKKTPKGSTSENSPPKTPKRGGQRYFLAL
jgi:hypothetical protein